MKRGICYSTASSTTDTDDEYVAMVPRYRTSSSFFTQLANTLPAGFNRMLLTKIAPDTFNVSAISDNELIRMSEWEEIAAYNRRLPGELQEVLDAIQECPLLTCASFYLDNGNIYIDPLIDYGTDEHWDLQYNFVHSELMPRWPIEKALDDLARAPRTPIEQLVRNKNCLQVMKLSQKLARVWKRIDEEERARLAHLDTEELGEPEENVFSDEDEDEEGGAGDHGLSEDEDIEESDLPELYDLPDPEGDYDLPEDDGEGGDEIDLHPSASDRASLEEEPEEDSRYKERYENGVRVMRARLVRPRKETDVRARYSRI